MGSEEHHSPGADPELERGIVTTIQALCQQLGISDYELTDVRWTWLGVRNLRFENKILLENGQLPLWQGLQTIFGIDDWKPLFCAYLIKIQRTSRKWIKLCLGLFLPWVAFLVLLPILLPALSILDVAVGLPLFFVLGIVASIFWSRQTRDSDKIASEIVGKQALLDSLQKLEAYLTASLVPENYKRIDILSQQEYETISGRKLTFLNERELHYSREVARRRIRALGGSDERQTSQA